MVSTLASSRAVASLKCKEDSLEESSRSSFRSSAFLFSTVPAVLIFNTFSEHLLKAIDLHQIFENLAKPILKIDDPLPSLNDLGLEILNI
jgi:hypothetical protein